MESTSINNGADMNNTETTMNEHEELMIIPPVKALRYLHATGVKFTQRMGLRKIGESLTGSAVSREGTKALSVFFESVNLTKHNDGKYPVPKDLEQYDYLKLVKFNENYTEFTVPEMSEDGFSSVRELELYKKAKTQYMEKYYIDPWQKKLDAWGLSHSNAYSEVWDDITGRPLKLEDYILDVPDINDRLAEGSGVIGYQGLCLIYVETREAMKTALNNICKSKYEIMPKFYKTFEGGTMTPEELVLSKL
jgi:hypothetical protein